jgi:hypothetical protein
MSLPHALPTASPSRGGIWGVSLSVLLVIVTISSIGRSVHAHVPGDRESSTSAYCLYLPNVALPAPVQIVSTEHYAAPPPKFPDLPPIHMVYGRLANISAKPVYNVTVRGRFFDASGQVVATELTTSTLVATFPNAENYFVFGYPPLATPDPPFARYEVAIESWSDTSEYMYKAATIVSQQFRDDGYLATLTVTLRNDQPRELRDIRVVTEGPGAYGTLVVDSLAPGTTTTIGSVGYSGYGSTGAIRAQGYMAP